MSDPLKPSILIVDDSAVVRTLVRAAIDSQGELRVAAAVGDGVAALKAVATCPPTVVLLDLEMPVMGGLETLARLRRDYPQLPVVVFSSMAAKGAEATLLALELGAVDCLEKPMTGGAQLSRIIETQLVPLVLAVLRSRAAELPSSSGVGPTENSGSPSLAVELPARIAPSSSEPAPRWPGATPGGSAEPTSIVVIGASTGGPEALTQLLTALPADLTVPLLVVQHMPPVFTRALAERLNEKCTFEVREAQEGDPLVPGQVLIAPGGRHMLLRRQGAVSHVRLTEDPPENSCRPAVDPTLRSVAESYGAGVLAVVLTGMGQDGLIGCQRVKQLGGRVLIQDRASSVVWGMPGAVHAAGAFDEMLPLDALPGVIVRQVARGLRLGKRA